MKLFWKIYLTIFVLLSLGCFTIFWIHLKKDRVVTESYIIEGMTNLAGWVAKETEVGRNKGEWPFEILKDLEAQSNFLFWWIVNADGVICLADRTKYMTTYAKDYFPEVIGNDIKGYYKNSRGRFLYIVKPFSAGNKTWSLWLGFSLDELRAIHKEALRTFLITAAIFLLMIGLVLFRAIRYFTRPIAELVQGAENIGKGNLDYKVALDTGDEMGQLARAFNAMGEALKTSVTSIERLHQEVVRRTRAEQDIEKAYEELKKMQDHLVEVEKLRALGELTTGIAHELKNPLGIILQGVEYFEKRKELGDDTTREIIDILKKSVRRADDIVESLSDFAIEKPFCRQPEDIRRIIDLAAGIVHARCREKKIVLSKEYAEPLPSVSADRAMMQEGILNLVLNAVQAMPQGGRLTLRVYESHLGEGDKEGAGANAEGGLSAGNRTIIVEVEDTGEGISPEILPRIFDPFFTTKRSDKCSGLGLTVVKKIMDLHKGIIDVQSAPGQGTKITLILKAAS